MQSDFVGALWNSTAALTSLTLHTPTGLFLAGSQATLSVI
jgi:hypothetical protein